MATDSVERVAGGAGRPVRSPEDEVRGYYETLLERLPWTEPSRRVETLGLTSCYSGEGVSTVAAELAVTAAGHGHRRVLLVDVNLARPSADRAFGVELQPGLAEVLSDPDRLPAAIRPTSVAGLFVLAAGKPDGSPAEVLDSAAVADLIRRLKTDFDLVVFDLPAAGQGGSAARLAALLDGLLLVVEAERVRWEVAQRTSELLRRGHVHLLGAVLNKRRQHVPNWLYRTL